MLFKISELTETQWKIIRDLVNERNMNVIVSYNGSIWELTGSDLYVLSDELGEHGEWELSQVVDKEYWEQYNINFDEDKSCASNN